MATLRAVDVAEDAQDVEAWINFQGEQDERQFIRPVGIRQSAFRRALSIGFVSQVPLPQALHSFREFLALLSAKSKHCMERSLIPK
ncbi:MAG: hypothetical protein LBD01_05040 [Puniceicoccales bacterium]|nr:hypothetical protein [Puniceicoccales bacterium]